MALNDIQKEAFRKKVEKLIIIIKIIRDTLAQEGEPFDIFHDSDFRVAKDRLVSAERARFNLLQEAEKNGLLGEECIARLHAA